MLNPWLVLLLGFAGCAVGQHASMSLELIQLKIAEICKKQQISTILNTVSVPDVKSLPATDSLSPGTGLTGMKIVNASLDSVSLNHKTHELRINFTADMSSKEVEKFSLVVSVSANTWLELDDIILINVPEDTSLSTDAKTLGSPLTQSMHSALTTTLNQCLKKPVTAGIRSVVNSINDQCAAVASATKGLTRLLTKVSSITQSEGLLNVRYGVWYSTGQPAIPSGRPAPPLLRSGEMVNMPIGGPTLSGIINALYVLYTAQITSASFQPHFTSGHAIGKWLTVTIQPSPSISRSIPEKCITSNVSANITVSIPDGKTLVTADFEMTVNLTLTPTGAAISVNVVSTSLIENSTKLTYTRKDCTCENMTQTLNHHIGIAIQNMAAQMICNGKNLLSVTFLNWFPPQPPLTGRVEYSSYHLYVIYTKPSSTPPGCPTCSAQ